MSKEQELEIFTDAPPCSKAPACSREQQGHLNRWILLGAFCLYCLLAGPTHLNWTPFADMLLKSRAYEWECKEAIPVEKLPHEPKCIAQDLAISKLFIAGNCSYFVVALFGGILLDNIGPKITALIGVSIMSLGWLLLGLASEKIRTYIPAFVFICSGIDLCFFPVLCSSNLFPTKKSTVIAVLGTFRSLAFVVPLVLKTIYIKTNHIAFSTLCYVFLGVGMGFCLFVAIFIIPKVAWKTKDDDTKEFLNINDKDTESVQHEAKMKSGENGVSGFHGLKRDFLSPLYLAILPYFVLTLIGFVFFIASTRVLITDAYDANQIIQVFSFAPCPLLGYCADRFGVLIVMFINTISGLFSYIFVMVPYMPSPVPLQYLASFALLLQGSFLVSQIYCYISAYFPQENMGFLIGVLSCAGGLLSLLTNLMKEYASRHDFYPMLGMIVGFYGVNLLLLCFVSYRIRKKLR